MKTLFKTVLILCLAASTLRAASVEPRSFDPGTIQKLASGDIVSSIELLPESKTHRCELMGIVDAPIDAVWEVISDYNRYHEFMPRTPVTFLVDPEAMNAWEEQSIMNWNQFEEDLAKYRVDGYGNNPIYFYNRFDMPFPLKDRFYLLKVERFPDRYRSEWIEIVGNTRVNEGSWTLAAFEGQPETTLVIYAVDVDPGLSLPASILESAMKKLPEIIRSLRQHIFAGLPDQETGNK